MRMLPSILSALPFLLLLLGHVATAHADWTATGTFTYSDRRYSGSGWTNTVAEPVRRADVQVFDVGTLAVLAEGSTDENGAFSIDIPDALVRTVGVRVLARTTQSPPLDLTVVDDLNGFAVYSFHPALADVPAHDPDTSVDFGTLSMSPAIGDPATVDWSSQVFNAFDMLVRTADWILAVDGAPLSVPCRIRWNPGNGRGGSSYSGGSNTVNMADDDGYDDANILHELGHFVEDEFGRSRNTGGSHTSGDDDQDPRLAWSEGFATYVSSAVLHQAALPRPDLYSDRDSFGAGGGFSYNFEGNQIGGSTRESAVSACLHDLVDGAATIDTSGGSDDDPLVGLGGAVWTVVEEMRVRDLPNTRLEDFWDLWLDLGLGLVPDLDATFSAHRVHFTPDDSEPNATFADAWPLTPNDADLEVTFVSPTGDPREDVDLYHFEATAGVTYLLEVDGGGNQIFGRPDPEMFLIDTAEGRVIAHAQDPLDTSLNTQSSSSAQDMDETVPMIRWRCERSDGYHLYLRHSRQRVNRTHYGTYQIAVSTVTPSAASVFEVSAVDLRPGESYPILVRGENFAIGATVATDDPLVSASEVRVLSPTVLWARITVDPAATAGARALVVTNAGTGPGTLGGALTVVLDAAPCVVISEVDPRGEDRVELRNLGSVPADLAGWQVIGRTTSTSLANRVFTLPAFTLAPGASVVVSEAGGTDTTTELYDPNGSVSWSWGSNGTGDATLLDATGATVDYLRFVRGFVTTHLAPEGTGTLWMQPEVMGAPGGATLSRHEGSALYRTGFGLSATTPSVPDGASGRENRTDRFEDNDAPLRAALLDATGTHADLAIDPDPNEEDVDWFGFPVLAGETPVFDVEVDAPGTSLALEVFAPGDATAPIAIGLPTADGVRLHLSSLHSIVGGVFLLRVRGNGGATGGYTLRTLRDAAAGDCDGDGVLDAWQIAFEGAADCDGDGVLDSCELDCDENGISDRCEILAGSAEDLDGNGVLDICEGFRRGDCNDDGGTDIGDAITLLSTLFPPDFEPSAPLRCDDACDGNDDGTIDIGDAIALLNSLFGDDTSPLLPPTGACGLDPTDDPLRCATIESCP